MQKEVDRKWEALQKDVTLKRLGQIVFTQLPSF